MTDLKIIVSAIVGDRVYDTGDVIRDAPDPLAEALVADGNAEVIDPNAGDDQISQAVQAAQDDAVKAQTASLKKAIAAARKAAGTEKADAVEKAIVGAFPARESADA